MCNLNVLINLKKQAILNCSFLSGATSLSYKDNDDGDGIYMDSGSLVKSENKLNLFTLLKAFKDSHLFITHQRLATSGKNGLYTQPFQNKDFVIAHNGTLKEYVKGDKSDTFIVFKEFIKLFNKSKGSRETRIIKTSEKLFNEEYGNWSIILYDKKTKNLYFFKDYSTDINFYLNKNKDILYITTNRDNQIFLNIFNEEFEELDIEDYTLYRIDFKNKIRVLKVVELDQKREWNQDDDKPKIPWRKKKRTFKQKTFKKLTIESNVGCFCEYCGTQTIYSLIYSGYGICKLCFNKKYSKIIKYERKLKKVANAKGFNKSAI